MNLEDIPPSLMKPCDDDDVVSDVHSVQAIQVFGNHLQNRTGRTLGVKQRSLFFVFDFRSNHSDRFNGECHRTLPPNGRVIDWPLGSKRPLAQAESTMTSADAR